MKFGILALLLLSSSAWAIEFQADKDHCKAGEFTFVNPLSGDGGSLLDTTAWAETGECVKLTIESLAKVANNINVLTFENITRIDGNQNVPLKGAELFDKIVTYEAYHQDVFCESAQWPLEWVATVVDGTATAPNRILITATRTAGGDSNGSYIKQMDMLIELLRSQTTGETSIHARFEVAAPEQAASNAVDAITQYAGRIILGAEGKPVPGATPDPNCPYTN
jgi:hypothetical protein